MAMTPVAGRRSVDFSAAVDKAAGQFRGLDVHRPGQWPILPRLVAFIAVVIATLGLGWFLLISDTQDALLAEEAKEPTLKAEYRGKWAQAVNLPELMKQKVQVEEYVTQLEKQLPGKADMDALLSDINQAGIGRGLQFELFRPGQVEVKDYYAELPISVKVSGRYHDIGAFAGDIANLSRIVTLHNLQISAQASSANKGAASTGVLVLDSTARTYRYLDPQEVEAVRQAKAKSNKAAAAGKGGKS